MIHTTAIIDPKANLAPDVEVGPYCVIGPNVDIDSGTVLRSHVVINGPTTIGKNNIFYQFASIGEDPQDKKYHGEASSLEIGDSNQFREGCTVHRGTEQGGMLTKLGSHNLIMASAHIAHDCILQDHIIMANYAAAAGHVLVDSHVTIGAFSAIHQFCRVGAHSFIARAAMVPKDILPFMMVSGPGAKVFGLNTEGLRRCGYDADALAALKKAYKIIFRQNLTAEQAMAALTAMTTEQPAVQLLVDALANAERGILR